MPATIARVTVRRPCGVPQPRRVAATVLLALLAACGGGGDGPAGTPAVRSERALSLDAGSTGSPVGVRVAHSANGDDFVVWLAETGAGRTVWAVRRPAGAGEWSAPVRLLEGSADLTDVLDLVADADGNAQAVWTRRLGDEAWSARFDAATGAWSTAPVPESSSLGRPSLSGNEGGDVLLTHGVGFFRLWDAASGTWGPRSQVSLYMAGTGGSDRAVGALDGDGNALGLFVYNRGAADLIGSTYRDRLTGSWDGLPPDAEEGSVLGALPGSGVIFQYVDRLQVTASGGGRFLAAWQLAGTDSPDPPAIRIARFVPEGRTWTTARTVVPGSTEAGTQFQRLGSDAAGHARLLLWTETDGGRSALKALRLDTEGDTCEAVRTIDLAVAGGAARADLSVDPTGDAVAVWQQFEGGRADDGSRSNIAFSRFDIASGKWQPAALAEDQPGAAFDPRVSVRGGEALLAWIQAEDGANRVKVSLQPLAGGPAP